MASETDEMDQIMSELAQLEKEISGSGPTAAAPSADPVSSPADDEAEFEKLAATVAEHSKPSVETPVATSPEIPTAAPALKAVDDLADFRGSESDAAMDEFIDDLKEAESDPEVHSLLDSNFEEDEESFMDAPEQSVSAEDEGSLKLSLTGNMKLSLEYEQGGQSVNVSFSGSHLIVSLADGTEFKIPVRKNSSKSKLRAA